MKCECCQERDGLYDQKNANGDQTKRLCEHCMRAFCWGFGAGAWKQMTERIKPQVIVEAIGTSEISMDDLIKKVRTEIPGLTPALVRSSVLPLISTNRLSLTPEHKLRVHRS